ncbi:aspartate carbamoyltransferase [Alicyclobacillus mengziensis]|uniref:aspartate carbamoyltransferase n=1 Tax=Alicyclobacillus mengziensis TaxID=2931921 RepID=UPI002012C9E7|nr:aspartate carbamoyltransferase [Alicyclobacillus mengziensis]
MFGLLASPKTTGTDEVTGGRKTSAFHRTVRDLVTVKVLTRLDVESYIERAEELRGLPRKDVMRLHAGAVVASLFYEPSTRTRLSFETAALRIGAQVVSAENALDNSSAKKGERLEDTLRIVGSYADVVVVRHHENDTLGRAASFCPVPVVSAGAGAGEHPTQALLDVYTLKREFGEVDDLSITILGDLRYGRTVHSLLTLLTQFSGVKVTVLPVPGLELPTPLLQSLKIAGLNVQVVDSLGDALDGADAVYQTRIQTERLQGESALAAASALRLGPDELELLPAHARILHPLPRIGELDPALDSDPRAAYFRQAENGLFIRMAVLDSMLEEGIS